MSRFYNPNEHHAKLIKKSKDLYYKYYENDEIKNKYSDTKTNIVSHKLYLGIQIRELEDVEIFFNVSINVYNLVINDNNITAVRERVSNKAEKNKIILGLYENHFVFIKDINKLCQIFRCEKCMKTFTRSDNLLRHQKAECGELYKDMFTYGVEEFTHNDNIMKNILSFSKSKKPFIYPYFAVYDFESIASDIDTKKGKNTVILNKQIPISFSFGSNTDDSITHVVNKNTTELIKSLVEYMYKAQLQAHDKIMNEYYDYIKIFCLHKLKLNIVNESTSEDDLILMKDGKTIIYSCESNKQKYKVQRSINQIKKWLQFPVIGFNNSFYDINICKDYDFIKSFDPSSAIKQGSRYKSLSNDKICILDQMMYNPARTSLDKCLKSRETDMIKGHFPYKWLTRYNKLYEEQLPVYKYFESSKTSLEEYEKLNDIWKKENMKNMFDYLKYYNNLDVKPLIQAITKHKSFYYNLGFDMQNDAISLSGLAEK